MPCEKPPSSVRSQGTPVTSGSVSRKPPSRRRVEKKVSGSGGPTRANAYQCRPPGGGERAPHGDPDQPALRVEKVEKGEQVVLVGSAAVEQHERALRRARGGSDAVDQIVGRWAHSRSA